MLREQNTTHSNHVFGIGEKHADIPRGDRLLRLFPADLRVAAWNRELVQKGMSEMGREALADAKRKMGAEHRTDIISFADMIDLDEGRLP